MLIHASNTAYEYGEILTQIVDFNGNKNVHKTSLNLTVNNKKRTNYILGSNNISFQAANFQRSRDSWVFQPENHFLGGWQTSGTTIRNKFQYEKYDDVDYAVKNAPYLGYDIFFPDSGVYFLWGYGYVDGDGIYWSFGDDITDLRSLNLENTEFGIPKWNNFGTIYVEKGGVYNFNVYLKGINTVILDQWYFTTEKSFNIESEYSDIMPLSECPFNTVVRLKNLDTSGNIASYHDIYFADGISAWLPSSKIIDSGKFNYEIRNNPISSGYQFSNGLSLEYWQIGGNKDFFAAWDYVFVDSSVGRVLKSKDFGQNYD